MPKSIGLGSILEQEVTAVYLLCGTSSLRTSAPSSESVWIGLQHNRRESRNRCGTVHARLRDERCLHDVLPALLA